MIKTELISKAELPTKYGDFFIYAFKENDKEHVALVKGETRNKQVNVRIHSKCVTGDSLGSLRCDCGEQLNASMDYMGKNGGILIYLDQEGRGIGLLNKIRAYALQDRGFDTVESNEMLGFDQDARDYSAVLEILNLLGIRNVRLFTNNPEKVEFLRKNGIKVIRVPLTVKPNRHNAFYLETKKLKTGHLF
ncbi:MAG: GTP cyclohydrolase II [Candidatus Aenigmarchaeota archaeon]|nr:GTP cyclohydrolase II [Candidatus Aenigmarchaeota archaeon]